MGGDRALLIFSKNLSDYERVREKGNTDGSEKEGTRAKGIEAYEGEADEEAQDKLQGRQGSVVRRSLRQHARPRCRSGSALDVSVARAQ
jgi:hypothetical protein